MAQKGKYLSVGPFTRLFASAKKLTFAKVGLTKLGRFEMKKGLLAPARL
jgi:hypothetical protein